MSFVRLWAFLSQPTLSVRVVSTECLLFAISIPTFSSQRSKAILGALVKVASKTPVSKSFQLHRTDDKMKNCTGNKTKLARERLQQKHCHFSKVPSYILICEHKLQCFDTHVFQLFSSDIQLLDTSMDPLLSSHRNFKGFWRILFTKRIGDRNWVYTLMPWFLSSNFNFAMLEFNNLYV